MQCGVQCEFVHGGGEEDGHAAEESERDTHMGRFVHGYEAVGKSSDDFMRSHAGVRDGGRLDDVVVDGRLRSLIRKRLNSR
jgi:hypothetical protein